MFMIFCTASSTVTIFFREGMETLYFFFRIDICAYCIADPDIESITDPCIH